MKVKKTYRSMQVALLTGAIIGLGSSTVVFAHEDEHDMNSKAVGGEARLMHLAGEHTLTFGAGLTMIAQSLSSDAGDQSGVSYSADIAFEGDFGDKGTALVYLNTAQGAAVDASVGAGGGVNADDEAGFNGTGYSDTRIAEAWYKMPLAERVNLTVGKVDPKGIFDGNEVANDQTSQFLNDAFVNNAAIEFPGFTGAINLGVDINDKVSFNLAAFEAADDFSGDPASGTFAIAELGLASELMGQPTNVRLTGWKRSDDDNQGFALNADHAINDSVIVFVRYGTQEKNQAFDSMLSLGGQWAFGDDMLGVGYAQAAATGVGADNESQMEVYYSYALADHIHITADLQRINNPGFDASAGDATVMGLRIQTDM